ncbi:MAG: hypothetical protein ACTIJ7_03760 [Agrococcus casei]|uniref:hypothetical protein n=1 Tax=Agrococcus casei TaxID=343512 RepID=UPI003F966F81
MSRSEETAVAPETRSSDVVIVYLVFALLFGFSLFMAWGNFQGVPEFYAFMGIAGATPWVLLVAGIVVPPVLFVTGMAIARGRSMMARAGIMLAALAVNAQISLLLEQAARNVAAGVLG